MGREKVMIVGRRASGGVFKRSEFGGSSSLYLHIVLVE